MDTIYNRPTASLTEEERQTLETARQVLIDGNKLYGLEQGDVSHIEYALGFALDSLTHLFAGHALSTFVEIGLDDTGFFVSFLLKP